MYNVNTQSSEVLLEALSAMDTLDLKYQTDRKASMSSVDLAAYSTSVKDLKGYCHGTTLWINFYRQRVILSEFRILDEIEMLLEDRCPAILQADEDLDSQDWLVKLVNRVKGLIACGVIVEINSEEYFPCGAGGGIVFNESSRELRRRKYLPENLRDATTLAYVSRILHTWFGSDSSFSSQARTALVRILIDRLGAGCLLLPRVWQIYDELPNYLFDPACAKFNDANCKDTKFISDHLDDFDLELLQETLCDSDILARFDALGSAYLQMYDVTCAHADAVLATRSSAANLKILLVSLTSEVHERRLAQQEKKKKKEEAKKQAHARKEAAAGKASALQAVTSAVQDSGTSSITHPPLGDTNSPSSHRSQSPSSASSHVSLQVTRTIAFLEDALIAGNALAQKASHLSLNQAQLDIFNDGDYYQPIRELGPSRAIMNQGLKLDHAMTRAGFFSIMLFRFFHFNSSAFINCPPNLREVQFESVGAFETYLQGLRLTFTNQEDSYFCNPAAYGQPVPQRTVDRYRDYWDVSQRNDFVWPPNRSFAVTYEFYKTYKPKVKTGVDAKGKDVFRQLWAGAGKLNRYLLVADMCRAGLVDLPTVEDMAGVAAYLSKGAASGLQVMGFLTKGGTGPLIRTAFVAFYEAVTEELTDEQKVEFQWDPITAEHTLCKFTRITRRGYYW